MLSPGKNLDATLQRAATTQCQATPFPNPLYKESSLPDIIRSKALTQQRRLLRENKPSSKTESLSPVPQQLWFHSQPLLTDSSWKVIALHLPKAPFKSGGSSKQGNSLSLQRAPRQGQGNPGSGCASCGARERLTWDRSRGKQ